MQKLHNSLLSFKIYDEKIGKTVSGVHSHVLEDWPFITPTDISTLMLYQKFTNWESYMWFLKNILAYGMQKVII